MYIAATLFSDDDNFKNLQTYRKGMPRRLSLLDQGFRVLGLYEERFRVQRTTGELFKRKKNGLEPLTPELHHVYRKRVGILLYLAPERPDVMYVLKKLSTKLASPTNSDLAPTVHPNLCRWHGTSPSYISGVIAYDAESYR